MAGSLTTGTYQFSYRLINSEINKLTVFTIPSNPVYVSGNNNSNNYSGSAIGGTVNKSISLNVRLTSEEAAYYDYVQFAVVKNLTGNKSAQTAAFLLPPEKITQDQKNNKSISLVYDNSREEVSIDISEISIEDAAIKSAGTLSVTENIAFLGDIEYRSREFDRGEPEVSGNAEVIKFNINRPLKTLDFNQPRGFSTDAVSTSLKGYFRDEVYRFGIVYFDEFGFTSDVRVLDLSDSPENRAESDCIDFKFPKGTESGYEVFNSTDGLNSLGLKLKSIKNHPTWAKGFVIVRAKRKRDIISQTPLIPSMLIEPPIAIGDYPQNTAESTNQPGNPLGTLVPKNFLRRDKKHIIRDSDGNPTYTANDANDKTLSTDYVHSVFLPESIYNTVGETLINFTSTKTEKVEIVNIAALKLRSNSFNDPPVGVSVSTPGGNESVFQGGFSDSENDSFLYAISNSEYLIREGNSGTLPSPVPLIEYGDIFSTQESYTIRSGIKGSETSTFGDYRSVEDSNQVGFKPNNQRKGVIVTDGPIADPTTGSYAGLPALTAAQSNIHANSLLTNRQDEYLSYINIANIRKGLNDFRYGSKTDFNEYISTGVVRLLSKSEVENNTPITVDVFGGDCFISLHNFKITDRTYSLTYADTEEESKQLWGNNAFYTFNGARVRLPVGIKSNSQNICLFLESEVNSDLQERTIYRKITNNMFDVESKKEALTSLTYDYNLSYSLQNEVKKFFARPVIFRENNKFKSRVVFSDSKIYQSDEEGFDRFRVANTYDLEEAYGLISKLVFSGSDLISLQETGIAYLPVNRSLLETADASSLSIRSSDVLSSHRYIAINKGCQHPRTVCVDNSTIYFLDNNTRDVVAMSGGQITSIKKNGANSFFDEKLATVIPRNKITAFYDYNLGQYTISSYICNNFSIVFNSNIGSWVSELSFNESNVLFGGAYTSKGVYVIGISDLPDDSGCNIPNGSLRLDKYGNGKTGTIFGFAYPSSVVFSVNPQSNIPKVFDVVLINSTDRLKRFSMSIERESFVGNQVAENIPLENNTQKEGNYRAKILRDQVGARMRGLNANCTLEFNNSLDKQVSLTEVFTKYRPSYNIL